jgi:hypothetical protein
VSTDRSANAPTGTLRRRGVRVSLAACGVGIVALFTTACGPTSPQDAVRSHWGDRLYPCAAKIVQRESRWTPTAVSPGGGNIGLFQLNSYHKTWIKNELGYSWTDLKDAKKNAHAAKVLSAKAHKQYGDGWQPWRLDGRARPGGGCPA